MYLRMQAFIVLNYSNYQYAILIDDLNVIVISNYYYSERMSMNRHVLPSWVSKCLDYNSFLEW